MVTPVRRTGAEDVLGVGVDLRHLGHGPVERGVETSRLRQAGEGLGQRKGTAHVVGSCVGSSLVDDRESRPGARLNLQDRGPLHRPIRQKRYFKIPADAHNQGVSRFFTADSTASPSPPLMAASASGVEALTVGRTACRCR